jgi:hypothetical protein
LISGYWGELGQQGFAQDVIAAGDAYQAGRLVAQFCQHIQLRFDFIEAVADGLQQPLASDRRRDAGVVRVSNLICSASRPLIA